MAKSSVPAVNYAKSGSYAAVIFLGFLKVQMSPPRRSCVLPAIADP